MNIKKIKSIAHFVVKLYQLDVDRTAEEILDESFGIDNFNSEDLAEIKLEINFLLSQGDNESDF